jgi:hypothetical protein
LWVVKSNRIKSLGMSLQTPAALLLLLCMASRRCVSCAGGCGCGERAVTWAVASACAHVDLLQPTSSSSRHSLPQPDTRSSWHSNRRRVTSNTAEGVGPPPALDCSLGMLYDGAGRSWTDLDSAGQRWTALDGSGRRWTELEWTRIAGAIAA